MLQRNIKFTLLLPMLAAALVSVACAIALASWLPNWDGGVVTAVLSALLAVISTGALFHTRLLAPLQARYEELGYCLLAAEYGATPIADGRLPGMETSTKESHQRMLQAIDKFKSMAVDLADQGSRIAIASASVSFAADRIRADLQAESRRIDGITDTANRIEAIVNDSADSVAAVAEYAARARQASSAGQRALEGATGQMRTTNEQAQHTSELVAALENKSNQIECITNVISGIAEQTNLLALNAAIEAARAGEQGRGFALVADEVRGLAQKTSEASGEIGTMVNEIGNDIRFAAATMTDLSAAIADGADRTTQMGRHLQEIFADVDSVHGRVQPIADGILANRSEIADIANAIQSAGIHLQEAGAQLGHVSQQGEQLSSMAEIIHGRVLAVGTESLHACMLRTAQSAAQAIEQLFEQAVADEEISDSALFDRDYQPIEGTNPLKHKTRFDDFTDQVLPAIQEPILDFNPQVIYAGAVDDNGYFPTHNRRYAKPLTGNFEKDLVNNRTKRIFSDHTGKRCGSNTEPFLLQTYKRDTGEVVHDISVPIYVNGRHWGGFRMGYKAEVD
ncbi:MAG: methyl-accepting chemotaxis protein [Sedimenticolaceae bacterium]|jgi:methyl-accepting chemotaxis protein